MNSSLTIQASDLEQRARKYARASKAANTIRAYRAALQDFTDFCHSHGVAALPAEPGTVIAYLTFADQQTVSTLQVKLAAIAEAHRLAHLPDPTVDADVKTVMDGIRRTLKTRPHKKAPLLRADLKTIMAALPDTLRGQRDRAIILVGFTGAFRRSELVALKLADLDFAADHLTITVRQSKTDQLGAGLIKTLSVMHDTTLCPVTALKRWLAESGITSGAVFRKVDRWEHVSRWQLSEQSIALIVKQAVKLAGLNPAQFAGHSLRSGFITEAANAGVEDRDIAAQTGHKSMAILHGYIQDAGRGASSAARAALGEQETR